jgi:Fe-S-cluster containining protein
VENIGIKTELNWNLPEAEFRRQIIDMIEKYRRAGKVIPLPWETEKGLAFASQLAVLLANLDCAMCNSFCCREAVAGEAYIELTPWECADLVKKGHGQFIKNGCLPMPCPFLKTGGCSIYADRPLVCVLYPWQTGRENGKGESTLAVSSSCPEGRRVALKIFMWAWVVLHRMQQILPNWDTISKRGNLR